LRERRVDSSKKDEPLIDAKERTEITLTKQRKPENGGPSLPLTEKIAPRSMPNRVDWGQTKKISNGEPE